MKTAMEMTIERKLEHALELLGEHGKITNWKDLGGRIAVYVDGEYYGVYDLDKDTFID